MVISTFHIALCHFGKSRQQQRTQGQQRHWHWRQWWEANNKQDNNNQNKNNRDKEKENNEKVDKDNKENGKENNDNRQQKVDTDNKDNDKEFWRRVLHFLLCLVGFLFHLIFFFPVISHGKKTFFVGIKRRCQLPPATNQSQIAGQLIRYSQTFPALPLYFSFSYKQS